MIEWGIILAHRHWFTLALGKYRIRLCARCSGTVIGYFLCTILLRGVDLSQFHMLKQIEQFFVCLILGLPSGIDWLTQTWGFRNSSNPLRGVLGLLIGAGAALLSSSTLSSKSKTLSLAGTASIIILLGYLGRLFRRLS